jgi:glycosyltransferase involved in cell wall biosynthesis
MRFQSTTKHPAHLNLTRPNGLPWIEDRGDFPNTMPDGNSWPKISIITPSFNQGQFIEETIRSVLLQGYPNLEYIIMDGGSTDGSVDIIRKYEKYLTYWVSESDKGQAQAINKGFKRASGVLYGWINSDDLLLPGSLYSLAFAYSKNPSALLMGEVINFYENSTKIKTIKPHQVNFEGMILPAISGLSWHQPGVYIPACLVQHVGFLDESLRYLFDQDWMCRLLQVATVEYISKPIAKFRIHANSKTVGENFYWLSEMEIVAKRYWEGVSVNNKHHIEGHLEMVRASTYLGNTRWNRRMGWRFLFQSLKIYPRICFTWVFVGLVIRSILPFWFLLWVKSKLDHLD